MYMYMYICICIYIYISLSLSRTLSPSLRKEMRHKVLITYSNWRKARIIKLQLQFFPVGDLRINYCNVMPFFYMILFFSEYNM